MPGLPTNFAVTSISTSQADMTWTNDGVYDSISVQRRIASEGYVTIEVITGTDTSYSDTSISANIRYYWRVVGNWSGFTYNSQEDDAAAWDDTHTSTLTLSDTSTVGLVLTVTESDTVTITDQVLISSSIKINYGYYFASSDGKIYEYSSDYQSDAGTNILSWWQSKRLDFSDAYQEFTGKRKTIQKVQLKYQDLTSSTPMTVYLSTDGGVTWASSYKELGTGDGKAKTTDFFFINSEQITGEMFSVKIESSSTSKKFMLLGIDIYFIPKGKYFEI